MSEPQQCTHILSDGRRCEAFALTGKTLCFSHDPESREAKLEAVRKGGLAKEAVLDASLVPCVVAEPRDVVTLLSRTIGEVRAGKLDLKTANCIGFLSGHLMRAFEVAEVDGKMEHLRILLLQVSAEKGKKRGVYGR